MSFPFSRTREYSVKRSPYFDSMGVKATEIYRKHMNPPVL